MVSESFLGRCTEKKSNVEVTVVESLQFLPDEGSCLPACTGMGFMASMNRGVKFHFKGTESAVHLTLHPQHRNKVTLIIQKILSKL